MIFNLTEYISHKITCFEEDLKMIRGLREGEITEFTNIVRKQYQGEERVYFTERTEVKAINSSSRAKNHSGLDDCIFRSQTEKIIANELENRGILYFVNARARVGDSLKRKTRELDFLIFYRGKVGILEVDGPHHTPSTSADEYERDRLFKREGILVIERFKAEKCYENPTAVINELLAILT